MSNYWYKKRDWTVWVTPDEPRTYYCTPTDSRHFKRALKLYGWNTVDFFTYLDEHCTTVYDSGPVRTIFNPFASPKTVKIRLY